MRGNMNKFTKTCVGLAKEVLQICNEQKIPCILSDETVYQLRQQGTVKHMYLIVKADDLDRLQQCLASRNRPNRAVESMKNNNRYPDFSLRYVDTKSTCGYKDDVYLYSSVGVVIIPLRKRVDGWKKRFLNWLEHWGLGTGKQLYPKLLAAYRLGEAKGGCVEGVQWNACTYDVSELSGKRSFVFGGVTFPVSALPAERKEFSYNSVKYVYCAKATRKEPMEAAAWGKKHAGNLYVELAKAFCKRCIKKLRQKANPINHDWMRINCVNERDLLQIQYEKKKPFLRELFKNKSWKRLKAELKPYHAKLKEYYKETGMTIVFDEEIFDMYCHKEVYGKNEGYIHKISQTIPIIWRSK